jgi:hypothetical protein
MNTSSRGGRLLCAGRHPAQIGYCTDSCADARARQLEIVCVCVAL